MNTHDQAAVDWYQANGMAIPHFTPEQLYPFETFVGNEEGKAVNFIFYAFEIYRKHLFPYYHALKQANPSKKVVIQEDNAPYHTKARRLLHEIFKQGSEFMDHPSNSPDLAPIETVQWEHPKKLDWFTFEVKDAKKATRDKAMALMKDY